MMMMIMQRWSIQTALRHERHNGQCTLLWNKRPKPFGWRESTNWFKFKVWWRETAFSAIKKKVNILALHWLMFSFFTKVAEIKYLRRLVENCQMCRGIKWAYIRSRIYVHHKKTYVEDVPYFSLSINFMLFNAFLLCRLLLFLTPQYYLNEGESLTQLYTH